MCGGPRKGWKAGRLCLAIQMIREEEGGQSIEVRWKFLLPEQRSNTYGVMQIGFKEEDIKP